MRISNVRTHRQLELEEHREALRDRRWSRRRSMLGVAGRWAFVGTVAMAFGSHLSANLLARLVSLL